MKNKYGLIGEKLGHSFSKVLHNEFGNNEYGIMEIPKDEVDAFMKEQSFEAINVTIPYKETVMKYCVVDETAKAIGSVNTIVKKDGVLYGYNTDYLGFEYMVNSADISFKDKDIVILGSGGTSKTACFAASRLGAKSITVVSRKASRYDTSVTTPVIFTSYEDVDAYKDANILINTTPVGMNPNNNEVPVDLELFKKLDGLVDVIYNPLTTKLASRAKAMNIKSTNGLSMLIAQGWYAERLFFGKSIELDEEGKRSIERVYKKTRALKENIVFTGMPGCGKSTQGKRIAEALGREFIDTDIVFNEKFNMNAGDYIVEYGEKAFRDKESEVIEEVSKNTGVVIAIGGGSILRESNVEALKANGFIIYLSQELEKLSQDGRPLSQNGGLEKLYNERKPIYERVSDVTVKVQESKEDTFNMIKEQIDENSGN